MSTPKMQLKSLDFTGDLRLSPEDEVAFQKDYTARTLPRLRSHVWFLAIANALPLASALMSSASTTFIVASLGVFALNLLLLILFIRQKMDNFWQPAFTLTTLVSLGAYFALNETGVCFFLIPSYTLLICFRIQQLQFRWTVIQVVGTLLIFVLASRLATSPENIFANFIVDTFTQIKSIFPFRVLLGLTLLGGAWATLFSSFKSEKLEKSEFLRKNRLVQERAEEKQKQEQTERMLHILSQAIGGIVHDLGNPLTAVQGGAQTLLDFTEEGEGEPDEELVVEFAEMITDGAQMLNYLRLSLMEQTRVLEGKPVPVELKPASIRHIIDSGVQYQKPKFAAGRHIVLQGNELEICVDEMRLITVFMNLIGNALKYSDGEIRVAWRTSGENLLVAVEDQGRKNHGLSQVQAQELFVPFGRLDTHAQIEGTGLGLLSVRKIAEAHRGEIYIEGHTDGSVHSMTFSTAQNTYETMLEEGFLSAFVVACPLKVLSQGGQVEETYST